MNLDPSSAMVLLNCFNKNHILSTWDIDNPDVLKVINLCYSKKTILSWFALSHKIQFCDALIFPIDRVLMKVGKQLQVSNLALKWCEMSFYLRAYFGTRHHGT